MCDFVTISLSVKSSYYNDSGAIVTLFIKAWLSENFLSSQKIRNVHLNVHKVNPTREKKPWAARSVPVKCPQKERKKISKDPPFKMLKYNSGNTMLCKTKKPKKDSNLPGWLRNRGKAVQPSIFCSVVMVLRLRCIIKFLCVRYHHKN